MPLVKELMTSEPHVLSPTHFVYHAFATMELYHLRHIPIVDQDGRLIGIVSDRDLKRHMHALFDPEQEAFVGEVMQQPLSQLMTPEPLVARPNDTLKEVLGRMMEQKISAMVIVDGDRKPVGILTDTDMMRCLHSML